LYPGNVAAASRVLRVAAWSAVILPAASAASIAFPITTRRAARNALFNRAVVMPRFDAAVRVRLIA
jgi:hypothetical protein